MIYKKCDVNRRIKLKLFVYKLDQRYFAEFQNPLISGKCFINSPLMDKGIVKSTAINKE